MSILQSLGAEEVLVDVCAKLAPVDLLNIAATCTTFHNLVFDEALDARCAVGVVRPDILRVGHLVVLCRCAASVFLHHGLKQGPNSQVLST